MTSPTLQPHSWYVGALHAYTTNAEEAEKMQQQYPVVALYSETAMQQNEASLLAKIHTLKWQIGIMRMPAKGRINLIEGAS